MIIKGVNYNLVEVPLSESPYREDIMDLILRLSEGRQVVCYKEYRGLPVSYTVDGNEFDFEEVNTEYEKITDAVFPDITPEYRDIFQWISYTNVGVIKSRPRLFFADGKMYKEIESGN